MGWLQGSTDITNFTADLYSLLTGGMAAGSRGGGQAGNGVTLNVTDQWIGVDATNRVIRSQRTESPFTAEYGLYRGIPRFAARSSSTVFESTLQTQIGKPTFSGSYSGITVRAYFACFVSTVNSAPGNLSGTVVTFTLVNADTGATVASGTVSGWTGSSNTQLVSQGVSLTLTLQVGQSFVAGTNAVMWLRTYTTTHTQGIDYFPEGAKVTTAGITVSNSSGGAANYTGGGTDYTLVQELHTFPGRSVTIGFDRADTDWGGTGCGSGIAWNAGGSPPAVGANYFVPATYLMHAGFYQVPSIVSIGGNFSLTGAPMDCWDATLQVGRWVCSANSATTSPKTTLNTTVATAQLFTGAGQAGATFVNFWISATQDKLIMVFRGDPGQSGRIVILVYQRLNSLQTNDRLPWFFTPDGGSLATQGATHHVTSKYIYQHAYHGDPSISQGQMAQAFWYGGSNSNAGRVIQTSISAPLGVVAPLQNPNNWDLRWWLYTPYTLNNQGGSNLAGTFDATKQGGIRGKIRGIFLVANDNFTTLDALIDSTDTYLLVIPTTEWGQIAPSDAVAILEE